MPQSTASRYSGFEAIRPLHRATAAVAGAAFLAQAPAHARGGGSECDAPMHFSEISRIKCDHFGNANSPWLNSVAEWQGAFVDCLRVNFPGQDPGFDAGSGFLVGGVTESDGTIADWVLIVLETGFTQPGTATVTSSTGACTLRFSVDVVFRDVGYPFEDTTWVYLVDDAPLLDGQRVSAGTHYFEWRLKGDADLARLCPPPCQVNVSGMPLLRFTEYVDPVCVGDLDGDGSVGAADLAILLGLWGSVTTGTADLDGDGVTGAADLSILLANWGECP